MIEENSSVKPQGLVPERVSSFILITVTSGRWSALRRLLASVAQAEGVQVRHVVVWLTDCDAAPPPLDVANSGIELRQLSGTRGLSRARNAVLADFDVAPGAAFVGFPDDDCWYPPGTLERIAGLFEENKRMQGISGRTLTPEGEEVHCRYPATRRQIRPGSAVDAGNSSTYFFKADFVRTIGLYDERFGLGAETGFESAEDTDYLRRAAELGCVVFEPTLVIYHPNPEKNMSPAAFLKRVRKYSLGQGALIAKYGPRWRIWYAIGRSWIGCVLALVTFRSQLSLVRLKRIAGTWEGAKRWFAAYPAERRSGKTAEISQMDAGGEPPSGRKLS